MNRPKLLKLAKKELKVNYDLKNTFRDIKYHFKNEKWPLNYVLYEEMTRMRNHIMFNVLLDYYGFIPYYDKKRMMVLIKPKKVKK